MVCGVLVLRFGDLVSSDVRCGLVRLESMVSEGELMLGWLGWR